MSSTYKQFLIHSNLRAYLDQNGRLTPMFPKTEFNTLEEVHARIDRYWAEWDEWLARRNVNLAKSFEIIKADTDLHDEATELEAERFAEKVDQYYEQQNLNQ